MAKPILLVRVHKTTAPVTIRSITEQLTKHIYDWHVLVLANLKNDDNLQEFKLEALDVCNATEIDIEQLKNLVNSTIENKASAKSSN